MSLLRILYVDDDRDIRAIAEMALALDAEITATIVASGAEALDLLERERLVPDVILLDVMMPDIDGPGVCAAVRRIGRLAAVPIIFMTARARAADIDQYLALGAIGVIVKPFDPMKLTGEIRALLRAADP
jgi:CheY-like chemotaxis protein